MDLAPLGLSFRPFSTGPDVDGYYPAPAHDESLNRIVAGLQQDEPFVAVTGGPGLGKTLLAHLALQQLGDGVCTSFVTNCHFSHPGELLQAVLYDFGLPFAGKTVQELRLALTDHALTNMRERKLAVIVLDDAQLLSPELLQEVRLLGNLESPRGRAIQVLMLGLPTLLEHLDRPQLHSLSQRLTQRVRLEPFSLQESVEYIGFQVERAGGDPDKLFGDEAVEIIARGSQGIPRVLNQATYGAMQLALKAEMTEIDAEAAMGALAALPFPGPTEPEEPQAYVTDLTTPVASAIDQPTENPWQQGPYVACPQRFLFTPVDPH